MDVSPGRGARSTPHQLPPRRRRSVPSRRVDCDRSRAGSGFAALPARRGPDTPPLWRELVVGHGNFRPHDLSQRHAVTARPSHIDGSYLFDRLPKTACMELAMFSRTLAFGVALGTLAAATSATAQVQQASPQQASPRQATPLANFPPTSSAGTAGRLQGQTGTSPNGSSIGVQSGSEESVSPAPLPAPEPRLEIRVR